MAEMGDIKTGDIKLADKTLLIVDDDAPYRQRLAMAMEKRGFRVRQAESVEAAIAAARAEPPHFAVVDLRLADGSGLDIVPEIRKAREDCRVVILTGYGNIATAVVAMLP
jgi:two-component system response regulator RegA